MLVSAKTRTTNYVSLKYLRERLSIPTDNGVVVARWSLIGTLRNYDGGGNVNLKKATGLISKTTYIS